MNKEKVRREISKCTDFVKKHPAYVFWGVEMMHRYSLIEARKHLALTKAYSNLITSYDAYKKEVAKRFCKKYWPRTKKKRFHQMRVGA